MCLNNSVFPLVRFKDGKRKILFDSKLKLTNLDEKKVIEDFMNNGFVHQVVSNDKLKNYNLLKNDNVQLESFVSVPCGHCEDCLKANARAWSIRILQEAKQYKNNFFITFTYDDDHLPLYGSLVKDEISDFNKKLKTYLNRNGCNSDFRFYGVGEYGSQTFRPHYHVIYFNLDLPDLKLWRKNDLGHFLFKSSFLEKVWAKGQIEIGSVSVESACYVARYCDKKKKNLTKEDLENMKLLHLEPEFSRMSRRPGIGANYIEQLVKNIENGCYKINYKNNDFSIPKFYTKKFEELLSEEALKCFKEYNNLISNDFTYRNLQLSNLVDLDDLKQYNENVVSKSKKKRGF